MGKNNWKNQGKKSMGKINGKIKGKNQWEKSMGKSMGKINGKNQWEKQWEKTMGKINGKKHWEKSMGIQRVQMCGIARGGLTLGRGGSLSVLNQLLGGV